MVDLLTVRQVQDILQVDRITIYRMLQDGRLRGSKIGQQWRFTRQEVERLVTSDPQPSAASPSPTGDSTFPVHCIQTVQDLFSNVSRLGALVVTPDGKPITRVSNACSLCELVLNSANGSIMCQSCWSKAGQRNNRLTCHAGLHYLTAPVLDGDEVVAIFLVGGFYDASDSPTTKEEQLLSLSQTTGLPLEELRRAALSVPVIDEIHRAEVQAWPRQAVNAVQSILQERTQFMQRLQQIANLTQLT
jgi:excisionase family DNA binding protein